MHYSALKVQLLQRETQDPTTRGLNSHAEFTELGVAGSVNPPQMQQDMIHLKPDLTCFIDAFDFRGRLH